jgi:hypothetical protein
MRFEILIASCKQPGPLKLGKILPDYTASTQKIIFIAIQEAYKLLYLNINTFCIKVTCVLEAEKPIKINVSKNSNQLTGQ